MLPLSLLPVGFGDSFLDPLALSASLCQPVGLGVQYIVVDDDTLLVGASLSRLLHVAVHDHKRPPVVVVVVGVECAVIVRYEVACIAYPQAARFKMIALDGCCVAVP